MAGLKKENQTVTKLKRQFRSNAKIPKDWQKLYNRRKWTHLRVAQTENKSSENSKNRDELDDDEMFHAFISKANGDPTNFKEAMESHDQEEWSGMVRKEM